MVAWLAETVVSKSDLDDDDDEDEDEDEEEEEEEDDDEEVGGVRLSEDDEADEADDESFLTLSAPGVEHGVAVVGGGGGRLGLTFSKKLKSFRSGKSI